MRKIKKPKEKVSFFLGILLSVVVMRVSGWGCIVRTVFRVPCPGCGMTRAIFSFFLFDFSEAFAYHPCVFCTPLVFLYVLFDGRVFGKMLDRVMITVLVMLFLITWILRLFCGSHINF